MWLQRIIHIQEQRKQDRELLIELERGTMALYANLHRDPIAYPEPYEGKHFYKLSYDEISEGVRVTGEIMFKLMSDRFKNKPLKRG